MCFCTSTVFSFKSIFKLHVPPQRDCNSGATQQLQILPILQSLRRYVVVTAILVIFIGVGIDLLEVLILLQYFVGVNGWRLRAGASLVSIGEFYYTKAGYSKFKSCRVDWSDLNRSSVSSITSVWLAIEMHTHGKQILTVSSCSLFSMFVQKVSSHLKC